VKKYTYSAKKSDIQEKWLVVDANGAVLGRLASVVASRLRGKHNPLFTPHVDTGDWVIVINADKIVEKLLPPQRIHWQLEDNFSQRAYGKKTRGSNSFCRKGHAAQK
jgi:ribosomal protein L13